MPRLRMIVTLNLVISVNGFLMQTITSLSLNYFLMELKWMDPQLMLPEMPMVSGTTVVNQTIKRIKKFKAVFWKSPP